MNVIAVEPITRLSEYHIVFLHPGVVKLWLHNVLILHSVVDILRFCTQLPLHMAFLVLCQFTFLYTRLLIFDDYKDLSITGHLCLTSLPWPLQVQGVNH